VDDDDDDENLPLDDDDENLAGDGKRTEEIKSKKGY
jgi:hypothetical protein